MLTGLIALDRPRKIQDTAEYLLGALPANNVHVRIEVDGGLGAEIHVFVVVEIEVVLQSVGADHVIATVGESEDNATRRILASRHRLETYRDIDVGVGTAGRDDHVERVVSRALNQRSAPS